MTQSRQKKSRKFRGSRNHGWGRVSGHHKTGQKGGHGLTSGKFKHKWTMYLKQKAMGFPERQKGFPKYGNPWFIGKKGFKRPQEVSRREAYEAMNLYELDQKLDEFVKGNIAVKEGAVYKIDLAKANIGKLLSKGNLTKKCEITVERISKKAKEKIEAQGSKVIIAE
jgi:large subunit ribosomal protein L15